MPLLRIAFVPFIVLTIGCRPAPQKAELAKSPLDALIESKLGAGSVATKNRNGSFTLCQIEKENPSNNTTTVHFIIIRMYDQKVVEEGTVTMGAVEWTGEYEVQVSHKPGQVELERNSNTTVRKIDLLRYLDGLAR